jgi:hypothetical protein
VSWPKPQPGLVIRYSYLWRREAEAGREEGVKDRPSTIILATTSEAGETTVFVLPITHTAPTNAAEPVQLPQPTKARLGLDSDWSWIVVAEGDSFVWPGPDLRFVSGRGPEAIAYGMLPGPALQAVRDRILALAKARKAGILTQTP